MANLDAMPSHGTAARAPTQSKLVGPKSEGCALCNSVQMVVCQWDVAPATAPCMVLRVLPTCSHLMDLIDLKSTQTRRGPRARENEAPLPKLVSSVTCDL